MWGEGEGGVERFPPPPSPFLIPHSLVNELLVNSKLHYTILHVYLYYYDRQLYVYHMKYWYVLSVMLDCIGEYYKTFALSPKSITIAEDETVYT